jgi:beta-alanine--pyruvate transaminase
MTTIASSTSAIAALLHAPLEAPPSLEPLWMPFTNNRAFKQAPRMLVSAKDMHFTDADGRKILDGVAGLWCVNAGHCRTPIAEAIATAARTLDYAPPFQMGHSLSFALAEKVADMLPGDLDHVFFVNSGSEAVDTALKIALAYHQARGDHKRTRFVGRQRGYHGVGFGGISVGGIPTNAKQFAAQLLPGVDHIAHTHDLARNAFSKGQPQHGAELADDLERVIKERGGDTIAAVIVEPVAGSTGVLIPPVGYLDRLRAICDAHGILLIFDEVITGFGRTGSAFGATRFNVLPDLICAAKGITNGAVPMGAVFARHMIYDTVVHGAPAGIELFHGYTYSGHPLAAAAGLATLDLYESEGLFQRAADLAPQWESTVHALRGRKNVIDVRNIGLVGAVELEPRDGKPGARAFDVFTDCFKRGVLVRQTGDIIALSPPLIIEPAQMQEIVGVLGEAIDAVA